MSDDVKRASEVLMDALHGTTAAAFLTEIAAYQNGERRGPSKWSKESESWVDGDVLVLPASVLAAAARFLKDNGIDRPGRNVVDLDDLMAQLPDLAEVIKFPSATRR